MKEYFVVYPKNSGKKLFETTKIERAEMFVRFIETQRYAHKLIGIEDEEKPETYEIVRIVK